VQIGRVEMSGFLSQLSVSYLVFLGISFVTYFLFLLSCTRGILYIFVFHVKAFKIGFLLIAVGLFCLFLSSLIYQYEEFLFLFNGGIVTSVGWYIQTILDFTFAFLMWFGCKGILDKLKVYFGKDGV
jgi:hypothetical protein